MCRKGRDLHLTHEYAVAGNTFQIHILKARLRILTSSLLEMPLRAPHACQHRAGALPEHPAPIPAPAEIQLQSQDRVRRHNAGRRRQETLGKTENPCTAFPLSSSFIFRSFSGACSFPTVPETLPQLLLTHVFFYQTLQSVPGKRNGINRTTIKTVRNSTSFQRFFVAKDNETSKFSHTADVQNLLLRADC